MPDEEVQMNFTGDTGDSVLRDGFFAYLLFRNCIKAMLARSISVSAFWISGAAGEGEEGSFLRMLSHQGYGGLTR